MSQVANYFETRMIQFTKWHLLLVVFLLIYICPLCVRAPCLRAIKLRLDLEAGQIRRRTASGFTRLFRTTLVRFYRSTGERASEQQLRLVL